MRRLITFSILLTFLLSFNTDLHARLKGKRLPPDKYATIFYKADGCLVLTNPADVGFGALVSSMFTVLNKFEKGRMAGLKVNFDSGCYLDPNFGPNWWEYFFEPINLGDDRGLPFYLNRKQVLLTINQGYMISRERSAELARKYFILKPHMQQELDSYIERHFQDYYVIGIHQRGTDKITESPLVPYKKTLTALADHIASLPQSERDRLRIYVATDEQAFLDKITELYPSYVICNDFVRSTNGQALHYSQDLYGSNYQKGKEAIIDCLLLSKCNLLIYPATSSFSLLATALNADLETIPL